MKRAGMGVVCAIALLFATNLLAAGDWLFTADLKNQCPDSRGKEFTDRFLIEQCTFSPNGGNPFFLLTPGLVLVLEGEDDGEEVSATITVLYDTEVVDGVTTRVVEERETEGGELVEVSRNYFAECTETGDVYYFGEDVDDYEDGEIVGHEGAWRAGENGARAGIIMPGSPLAGSRYYQEIAPGVALDRAEHLRTGVTVETEAGTFEGCLKVADSSPFEKRKECDIKYYCPGIGVVVDEDLELVSYTPAP